MGSINISYRTIYFRPKLAIDFRIPVAALIQTPKGSAFIEADNLPSKDFLGAASHSLLEFVLDKISKENVWDKLPDFVGPHFELGDIDLEILSCSR